MELANKEPRKMADYGKFIGLALALVIAIALVPVVFEAINGTDTSDWGGITGGAGALAIFELLLLIFVAAIVIYIIKESITG